jgi:hypothetical protein
MTCYQKRHNPIFLNAFTYINLFSYFKMFLVIIDSFMISEWRRDVQDRDPAGDGGGEGQVRILRPFRGPKG